MMAWNSETCGRLKLAFAEHGVSRRRWRTRQKEFVIAEPRHGWQRPFVNVPESFERGFERFQNGCRHLLSAVLARRGDFALNYSHSGLIGPGDAAILISLLAATRLRPASHGEGRQRFRRKA